MVPKIKWVNDNPGGQPDERGYWTSLEGRFSISPRYRHTIYPDAYHVSDRLVIPGKDATFDTVRECKAWAQSIVEKLHDETP